MAGNAEAEGYIPQSIHGDAAHPAMIAIGSIGAFLIQGPVAAALAHFIPANAGMIIAIHIHRVVYDQCRMIAEIAVLQAIHQAIGDSIKICAARLWDTVTRIFAHVAIECSDGDIDGVSETGVIGIVPIGVELPHLQLIRRVSPIVIIHLNEVIGFARGRGRAFEMRGQHAAQIAVGVVEIEVDHAGGIPTEHLVSFENRHALTGPIACPTELVECHVIAVGPDAEFGIVIHLPVTDQEGITPPFAGRIGRLGNGDALIEGAKGVIRQCELADHPSIRQMVIQNHGITVILSLASAAKALPEGVDVSRAIKQISLSIPNSEGEIHRLNVMIGADVTVGVGRQHAIDIVDAFEGDIGRWQIANGSAVLPDRISPGAAGAAFPVGQHLARHLQIVAIAFQNGVLRDQRPPTIMAFRIADNWARRCPGL